MTSPAVVQKIRKSVENSWLEMTIHEGRKHQVKRMLEAVGHPVLKLKRMKFGPIVLGDLPPGQYRYLSDREANSLRTWLRSSTLASKRTINTRPPRAGQDRLSSQGRAS